MIVGTFGLPGCGKSTLATKKARQLNRKIKRDSKLIEKGKKPKCKYNYVLTNFSCKGCYKIDFSDIGVFDIQNCAIILDEITVDADNRDFKNFKKSSVEGFVYHRHYDNDIYYYTQQYDAVDKKIRNLTQTLYYARKSLLFPFSLFTRTKQIFRTIDINDNTKEIVTGYRFPNFFECFLSFFGFIRSGEICFRPFYYNDFDSYSKPLKLLPFKLERWIDMAETRSRSWTFLVYPESCHPKWRDFLDDMHLEWVESPLHEFDINPDGEPKKPHWHILVSFTNVKSYTQVNEISQSIFGTIPIKVHNTRSLVRYMAHLDNPDKFQYSINDIVAHGGIDVMDVLKPSYSERYTIISDIMDFCDEQGIVEFQDLLVYARVNYFDTWFLVLCDSGSYVISLYLKSARNRKRD